MPWRGTPPFAAALSALALAGPAHAATPRIAFANFTGSDADVFTVTPAGKDRVHVTHGADSDFNPEWSPDRRWIVVERAAGNSTHLYKVHPNGSGLKQIPHTKNALAPSWSRNGKLIAYTEHNSKHETVFTIRPDGSHKKQVTSDRYEANEPAWAPSGKLIAFERGGGIWRIQPDGKKLKKLTGKGLQPDWSPDGKHIAFVRKVARGNALFAMNADGTHAQQLALKGPIGACTKQNPDGCVDQDQNPSWAPGGKQIAYESDTSSAYLVSVIAYPGGTPGGPKDAIAKGLEPAW